jgi:hypothetical protein
LVVIGVSAIIHESAWWTMPKQLIESVCYVLLFAGFLSLRPARAYAMALPRAHQVMLGGVMMVSCVGQIADRPELTFPFISWWMYAEASHPKELVFYECIGIANESERVRLNPPRLFPSQHHSQITSKLESLAYKASSEKPSDHPEEHRERLKKLLRAIGRRHNAVSARPAIDAVEIVRCSLPWDRAKEFEIQRTPLLRVAIEPDASSEGQR